METINKQDLKDGKVLIFETVDKDDLRTAEIDFEPKKENFRLWFNGQYLFVGKSFAALKKRLEKLNTDWNLEYITLA